MIDLLNRAVRAINSYGHTVDLTVEFIQQLSDTFSLGTGRASEALNTAHAEAGEGEAETEEIFADYNEVYEMLRQLERHS